MNLDITNQFTENIHKEIVYFSEEQEEFEKLSDEWEDKFKNVVLESIRKSN